ncbi:MAG: hypothetical protein KHY77_10670, partial [Butyricicoccus pullicaecorum]|nr:hypothetical protein [Butyricicoccus pullicaecorum]
AAVRRERASGNDTEQCPVHGNVGTPQRGSVQPLFAAGLNWFMAHIFHEGSLMRPRCQSFRLCPRPALVVRTKKPPRTNTNQSADW